MSPAPLALTMGDPAGIGGEVMVGAWRVRPVARPCLALDDPARLRALGAEIVEIAAPEEAASHWPARLPVLPHPLPVPPAAGQPAVANAQAVIESIAGAVALARTGRASGVVTAPINKKALKDGAGFAFPGHTEFLAHLTGAARPVMMLAAPGLRVIPVTIHVALSEVPRLLNQNEIIETARIAHAALIADFGLPRPRLAVAGLNPHAGEGGAMGCEEVEVIAPALERLRGEGMEVAGPLPADTMFHPAARARYDLALCMYHDQALIPLKMLDFTGGVNVTLGLEIIRTSPDHGTAYDIAGRGRADPASMIAAIRMADEMARARGL